MVRKVNDKASPSMKAFAAKLFEIRTARGMTQEKLAEAINVTQQMVAKWETGRTEPKIRHIEKMADHFDVSIDELMGRKSANSPDRFLKLAMMTLGTAKTRIPVDIDAKLSEIRKISSGETAGEVIDPLTEEVFRMHQDDPEHFERLAKGIAAVVTARADGKASISDLVAAVLLSEKR